MHGVHKLNNVSQTSTNPAGAGALSSSLDKKNLNKINNSSKTNVKVQYAYFNSTYIRYITTSRCINDHGLVSIFKLEACYFLTKSTKIAEGQKSRSSVNKI